MTRDVEGILLVDETPEADAVEQHRAVDFDDDVGLDTAYLNGAATDRHANEADLIDQAFVIPVPDDDWDFER